MYLLVLELVAEDEEEELELDEERPQAYVGSGTAQDNGGVVRRLRNYELGTQLPKYVKSVMQLGYTGTSLGVMLSIPVRPPDLVRCARAFIRLMEATFKYGFWAVYCTKDDHHQYAMEHNAFWDRRTLDWDGLCSHTPLKESIGPLSAESLGWSEEEYNAFYVQMAENRLLQIARSRARQREKVAAGDKRAIAVLENRNEKQKV